MDTNKGTWADQFREDDQRAESECLKQHEQAQVFNSKILAAGVSAFNAADDALWAAAEMLDATNPDKSKLDMIKRHIDSAHTAINNARNSMKLYLYNR